MDSVVATRDFTSGLTAPTALAEMSARMVMLTGTDTTNPEVITTSILPADVNNVADVPANITFQLDNGEGPVGGFNANTYTGGTNAVTTGIDLVNNEGMLWIIPADTGGSGIEFSTIFDTVNFMNGVAPNFLQTRNRNSQGPTISGEGIDRFTTTGWEQDDDSPGSLNRTGNLNTQLSFAVTPDLFAMVDYTGAAGPNGDGTAAPHTIPHTLGSVPGAILIKRTGVAPFGQSDWVFYHKDVFANNDVGYFNFSGNGPSNDTNNPSHFNGTHPTASVFTVGNSVGSGSGNTNSASNGRYISYIFASNELANGSSDPNGNIYCGAYDGNGSSTVRNFPLGWRPTRVIIKDVTNDNVVTMAFTNLNANGVELTQYAQIGNSRAQLMANPPETQNEPTVHPAWGGSFEDTSFRLATNNNLWNRSNTRYVYIAMRESVPPAPLPGLVSDEPVFTGTGANGLVVDTGVDFRSGGLTFFGAGGSGGSNVVTPNVLNNFGRLNTGTGPAGARGNQERLPAFNTHLVQRGPVNVENVFATFQETGLTLTSNTNINTSGRMLQPFSFADAPGFMDSKVYTSTGSGGTSIRNVVTHSLGTIPQMVMIKNLTLGETRGNATEDYAWTIWHRTTR